MRYFWNAFCDTKKYFFLYHIWLKNVIKNISMWYFFHYLFISPNFLHKKTLEVSGLDTICWYFYLIFLNTFCDTISGLLVIISISTSSLYFLFVVPTLNLFSHLISQSLNANSNSHTRELLTHEESNLELNWIFQHFSFLFMKSFLKFFAKKKKKEKNNFGEKLSFVIWIQLFHYHILWYQIF